MSGEQRMTVTFTGIDQATQQIGGDEHMLATVHCTIAVGTEAPQTVAVRVKQTVGERLKAPFEIDSSGYKRPLDRKRFGREVEKYFRSQIHVQDGISESPHVAVRMEGNTFRPVPVSVSFPVPEGDGSRGAW